MPTVKPEAPGDERGALLMYLEEQRGGIRRALHGLTEEQARSTPSASTLSLAGLLKHIDRTELNWLRRMREEAGDPMSDPATAMKQFEEGFRPGESETVEVLLERYADTARATEAAVRAVGSLDDTFVTPRVPWDEGGPRSWRWALLHLIEETARHAGHADIIRETIDGKSALELVFAAGAMPEPDWSAFGMEPPG